jgi:hypothetical protein
MPGALLAIAYTALFLYLMRRMPFFARVPGLGMRTIAGLFVLKISAGTALWAVYTYVYADRSTADIFKYFDDSMVLYDALLTAPGDFFRMLFGVDNDSPYFTEHYYGVMNNWIRQFENNVYNDSHTMIRFNAVLRLFSFGHYHVHTVFACFVSTTGLVALYRAVHPLLHDSAAQRHERGLMPAIFLWPSMLFWASGVLKESLLVFGLGLFLLGTIGNWPDRLAWRPLAAIIAGLAVMLVIKFYVLLCLIPGLLAWWWARARPGRPLLQSAIVHALALAGVLLSGSLVPGYDMLEMLTVKQRDFIGMATDVESGSLLAMPALDGSLWSFLRSAPHALYMSFLSPFAVLGTGPLAWMGAAENVLLLLLPVIALRYARPWRTIDRSALWFFLSFILMLALLIGWTVPVVGALVRYRVPMLPFVAFAALLVMDPHKLPRWLPLADRS